MERYKTSWNSKSIVLFHYVNVEGRYGRLRQRFEIAVDFVGFAVGENALQDVLKHGQFVWVVGQSELAGITPSGADDVVQCDQCRFAGDIQNRRFNISRMSALWIIKQLGSSIHC